MTNTPRPIPETLLSPRVDIVFKKIFGVDENKDLLISLVNSILHPDDRVATLVLKNPYNYQNFKTDKLSTLDIKAESHDGKRINIEMQVTDEGDYDKRALYNWAKLYTQQIGKTDRYNKLSKTIGIHLLNFLSIPKSPKYHNRFVLKEDELGLGYFADIELHTIELSKFEDTEDTTITELAKRVKTTLDKWIVFLKHYELLLQPNLPEAFDDTNIKKAVDVVTEMSFTAEERERYEDHLSWLRIEASAIDKAEERGIQQGLQQGKIEGLKQGIEEGKVEGKIEVARNLLKQEIDIHTIAIATGLSMQEIENLRD